MQIARKMVASRICDAIAAIGYTASSAVMDIVDNSISADAKNVSINFNISEGKTFSERTNVFSILIIDDGKGMDDEGVLSALDIGTIQTYPDNSLSKYGFGLKSAGFSLGPKISILSKKNNITTKLYSVDKRTLAEDYLITASEEGELFKLIKENIKGSSGTIVEISGCEEKNHDSAKKTIDSLVEKLGVTYSYYLQRKKNPLKIVLGCTNRPKINVTPRDILHRESCIDNFDKDTYDCTSPILRKDVEIPISEDPKIPPLRLEVVLFPPKKITSHPGLSDILKERIKSFDVSRKNKGFFIYRNDRLIRWGDDLEQMINKDDLLFRARLRLTTAHDEILHVDVSKQNLFVPEDIYERIAREIRIPLREMDDIRKKCDELLKDDEGQPFNIRNQDLTPEDDEPPQSQEEKKAVKERKSKLAVRTRKILEATGEESNTTPVVDDTKIPLFQRVRYSNQVGLSLWEMGEDVSEGTFVRINTNHSFYRTVLAKLPEDSPARQAIEALLWASAVGESITYGHCTHISTDVIDNLMNKFKRVSSNNLDTWSSKNQDLFDND